MTRDAILGVDVGTSSVKVGLLWLDGTGLSSVFSRACPTDRPRPGWAQQDPDAWVRALADSWAELSAREGPVRLLGVGVCSQVNTHVLVDERLRPVYPAVTWQDIRAGPEAAELDAAVADRRTELWAGPFAVDASFALSRLLWLERHEPAARRAGRWLLSPKDYVVAALTGEIVTDPISPVGLVGPDERYIEGVVDLVPGARALLPELRAFDAVAGVVREDGAAGLPAGVPVAVGTMDAWASVFGSGVVRVGRAMHLAGTSEVLAVLSDRGVPTRGIISFAPVRGGLLHAGPTQAGGASLEWAARCFGRPVEEVLTLAAEARRDPQPIVFLPHLAGERAPVWDPSARGVFLGLTTSTELRHLALAVLEGVAFSARHVLGECERAAGLRAEEVRLSGGGARNAVWNQVKATVHGRPLARLAALDSAVLGVALMGVVAAGLERDILTVADRAATVAETIEPEAAQRARLDDLYGAYRQAYEALVPLFARLGGVAR